jgi:ABC-2 type transport system permease protein
MAVKKNIRFIWEYFKINLQNAMEYRASFLMQSGFMFLNDIIWVLFWLIFFNKFNSINSWAFNDIMIMYVVITIAWGTCGVFFGNFRYLAEIIRDGQLDFYLALPKNELTHVLISRMKYDSFGDLVFGIVLAIIFLPLIKFPLALILIALSIIILLSFAIILGSLSFFIGSGAEVANQGLMGALSFASYPFNVFSGWTKFILLIIIPAGFISGIPVELLKNFDPLWFGAMILFAAIFFTLALIIFRIGLKRYESGNLISARI